MPQIWTLAGCVVLLFVVRAHGEQIYSASSRITGVVTIHDQGDGVWETSSSEEIDGGFEYQSHIAQRITFGGDARESSVFSVTIGDLYSHSFLDTTLNLTLELRDADGDAPGNLRWSGTSSVLISGELGSFRSSQAEFLPGIVLPDSVYAVLSYDSVIQEPGTFLGCATTYRSIPTVTPAPPLLVFDAALDDWVVFDTGGNTAYKFLMIEVDAIPAPGAMALLGLAACGRRRR